MGGKSGKAMILLEKKLGVSIIDFNRNSFKEKYNLKM